MPVVMLYAVIVFQIVNVWDLHRGRAGEILAKIAEYNGYGVAFRDPVNRSFEQTTAIPVGLLGVAGFAAELWDKRRP